MRWRARKSKQLQIDPDEILLDASNLPSFNTQQFEGRIERALSPRAIRFFGIGLVLIGLVFVYRIGSLQITKGSEFKLRSEDNSLRVVSIQTERGVIYDRKGKILAWNDPSTGRNYTEKPGLSHVLGYVGLPTKDDLVVLGVSDPDIKVGKMGAEKTFDDQLRGRIGEKVEEVDSVGKLVSETIHKSPTDGTPIHLSVDSDLQSALYKYIEGVVKDRGFEGGAGVLMDVRTGEVLAITSYPEFPLSAVSGSSTGKVGEYLTDPRTPFLDRAVGGVYAPGSVIKPFIALGALTEGVINENTQILSTGQIEIPNPFSPGQSTIFKDWRAQGWVDVRHALAVSSDVFFYEVGGGFQGQKGIGISGIDEYTAKFGFGSETGINLSGEKSGTVPSPTWKKEIFDEPWRLGDTYHTAIGQYGFQVTPIQMVRGVAAIANGGTLLTPRIDEVATDTKVVGKQITGIPQQNFEIVREGMRLATQIGTAIALNVDYVKFAGKTGTAELGATKQRVNSWVEGFFPFDHPRYAFAIVMEKGHVGNTIGAAYVARQFFDWVHLNAPEYLVDNS